MRKLDTATLDACARHYAGAFMGEDRKSASGRYIDGPSYVMQDLYNLTYKDEWEHIIAGMKQWLGEKGKAELERRIGNELKPRDEKVLHKLLADKLAIDPDGAHIPGKIGTTVQHGMRLVGTQMIEVEAPESVRYRKRFGLGKEHRRTTWKEAPLYWPIYAGEHEERLAGSGVADPLPTGTPGMPVGALNTRISNECAILACDAIVDNLDEGTGAAIVRGYSGAQPADPDTAATGTLLFTLTCTDPAFGGASDAAPGATATAATVTDDSSADATATVGYCRASATNDGATPLDDHIDGEAGTSGADFNFNSVAISAGATVSMSTWTVTMPES